MTDNEQRIAIAEACGWNTKQQWQLPDYLSDLNAMHEAEKVWIIGDLEPKWIQELSRVVHGKSPRRHTSNQMARATARQRAEAFLRTLNMWKE